MFKGIKINTKARALRKGFKWGKIILKRSKMREREKREDVAGKRK
jgi:hypothetical protein